MRTVRVPNRVKRIQRRVATLSFVLLVLAVGLPSAAADAVLPDDGAEATAARLAPGASLEMLIANDVAYRQSLGFRYDRDYVRSLYAHPELTTGTRDDGVLLTPTEAIEERLRRVELPVDVETIQARLNTLGHATALGSIFIDHEAGGKIAVLLTRDIDTLRLDLSAVVRHPERLDVRRAPVTEAALNAAMNNLDYAPIVAKTGPVFAAGVDTAHSRILMHVADPDTANRTNAGASVGVPVWFIEGSEPIEATHLGGDRKNDVEYAPPYRGGHGITLWGNRWPRRSRLGLHPRVCG